MYDILVVKVKIIYIKVPINGLASKNNDLKKIEVFDKKIPNTKNF